MLSLKALTLLILVLTFETQASESWQGIPRGENRLKSSELLSEVKNEVNEAAEEQKALDAAAEEQKALDAATQLKLQLDKEDGIYASGQGELSGAFGISFRETLDEQFIIKDLGWQNVPDLPKGLVWERPKQQLTIANYLIKPPAVPKVLKGRTISYRAFTNFDGQPLFIQAKGIPNIKQVLPILERKYGKPLERKPNLVVFAGGGNALYIHIKKKQASINYYDISAFNTYLDRRKVTLRLKFKEVKRENLSLKEIQIISLADQLMISRQNGGAIFGLAFGKRVGFLARPDEYTELKNVVALKNVPKGIYKAIISPELQPVLLRYELRGSAAELKALKQSFVEALRIVYRGFLKNTVNHSVISYSGMSISVMIRKGVLSFSVLNSDENTAFGKRMKLKQLAERQANADRMAEIARIEREKRLAKERIEREKRLAKERKVRKEEIKEETGF